MRLAQFVCAPQFFKTPKGLCGHTVYKVPTGIMKGWKDYFSRLLYVGMISDIRQMEIRTAEPLGTDSSLFEVEIAIAKLKSINCQVVIKFRQN
jgi:hypothetical protein